MPAITGFLVKNCKRRRNSPSQCWWIGRKRWATNTCSSKHFRGPQHRSGGHHPRRVRDLQSDRDGPQKIRPRSERESCSQLRRRCPPNRWRPASPDDDELKAWRTGCSVEINFSELVNQETYSHEANRDQGHQGPKHPGRCSKNFKKNSFRNPLISATCQSLLKVDTANHANH